MMDDQIPTDLDYARALRLLAYTPPGEIDLAGVNSVLVELHGDNRLVQVILALCYMTHSRDPHMRTEQGRNVLRTVIAELTRRLDDTD